MGRGGSAGGTEGGRVRTILKRSSCAARAGKERGETKAASHSLADSIESARDQSVRDPTV